jgi:plasmid stabilization system protein ParE
MKFKYAIKAREDIRVAKAWWKKNRDKAPTLLRDELKRALALLKAQPLIGEQALTEGVEGLRRFYLQGSHYFIYYAVHDEDVEVLRLWHASRGEQPQLRPRP